jgi:hypothetical protein
VLWRKAETDTGGLSCLAFLYFYLPL